MLRSIKKAFDMVRQQDAETAVTVHTIRMWCKEGKIKCLTALLYALAQVLGSLRFWGNPF